MFWQIGFNVFCFHSNKKSFSSETYSMFFRTITFYMRAWMTKLILSCIDENTLYESTWFYAKIIRILKIFSKFPTVNIYKCFYKWCALLSTSSRQLYKRFSWYLDGVFLLLDFIYLNNCTLAKYCSIPNNHISMESIFIKLSGDI